MDFEKELENQRIKVVHAFEILDTPPNGTFDNIVQFVAELLHVPICLVTIVDTDRIWFKSSFGIGANELTYEQGKGLCSSAILSDEFYTIKNTLIDQRTIDNDFINTELGLRFYAATPLITKQGFRLGTLCVIDKIPREITKFEEKQMEFFASIIMTQLELRLQTRTTIHAKMKMEYIVAHDLKSRMRFIPKIMEVAKSKIDNNAELSNLLDAVSNTCQESIEILNDYIKNIKPIIPEIFQLNQKIELNEIINKRIDVYKHFAIIKNQKILFTSNDTAFIAGNYTRFEDLIDNILDNAIKFSPNNTEIRVKLIFDKDFVKITFTDQGFGMLKNDIEKVFSFNLKYSNEQAKNEHSSNLGLWIAKEITTVHNGKLQLISDGINKGTIVIIEFPLVQ